MIKSELFYQSFCPFGNVVCILLEQRTISHAEEKLGFCVVNGVILYINVVCKCCTALAVQNGLIVTRNNFCDGNIMTAFHDSLSNACSIDGRVVGGYKKKTDEITSFVGTTDEIDLAIRGKDGLKNETQTFAETLLTLLLAILCCF